MCGIVIHLHFTKLNSVEIMGKLHIVTIKRVSTDGNCWLQHLQLLGTSVKNHHATTIDGLEMGCYQGHYNGWAALVSYHPTAPLKIVGCGGESPHRATTDWWQLQDAVGVWVTKIHCWNNCQDLKVVALLVRMQHGFTKFCCFLCEWNSPATHGLSSIEEWNQHEQVLPGQTQPSETNSWYIQRKLYLPSIHIKLGMMKNFVSAMGHNGKEFQ
jgi:hypothetical protein